MTITVQELKEKLDSKEEFVFIDVREEYEFEEFNLGAKLIPMGQFSDSIASLEEHKENEIVVHCRSGNRSGMAQMLLMEAGFKNVKNLVGGVIAWEEKFGS